MNQNSEQIEARLCEYIDGELAPADREEIERYMAANPAHRALLQQLRHTRELLADLPREQCPADLAEALQGQLERSMLLDGQQPETLGRIGRAVRWPRSLAAAAVLFLAIGLGAVVYFVLSPSYFGLPHDVAVAPETGGGPLARDKSGNQPMPSAPAPAPGPTTPAPQETLAAGEREHLGKTGLPADGAGKLKVGDDELARRFAQEHGDGLAAQKGFVNGKYAGAKSADGQMARDYRPEALADTMKRLEAWGLPRLSFDGDADASAAAREAVVLVYTDNIALANEKVQNYLAVNNIDWTPADDQALVRQNVQYSQASMIANSSAFKQREQRDNRIQSRSGERPDALITPVGPTASVGGSGAAGGTPNYSKEGPAKDAVTEESKRGTTADQGANYGGGGYGGGGYGGSVAGGGPATTGDRKAEKPGPAAAQPAYPASSPAPALAQNAQVAQPGQQQLNSNQFKNFSQQQISNGRAVFRARNLNRRQVDDLRNILAEQVNSQVVAVAGDKADSYERQRQQGYVAPATQPWLAGTMEADGWRKEQKEVGQDLARLDITKLPQTQPINITLNLNGALNGTDSPTFTGGTVILPTTMPAQPEGQPVLHKLDEASTTRPLDSKQAAESLDCLIVVEAAPEPESAPNSAQIEANQIPNARPEATQGAPAINAPAATQPHAQ